MNVWQKLYVMKRLNDEHSRALSISRYLYVGVSVAVFLIGLLLVDPPSLIRLVVVIFCILHVVRIVQLREAPIDWQRSELVLVALLAIPLVVVCLAYSLKIVGPSFDNQLGRSFFLVIVAGVISPWIDLLLVAAWRNLAAKPHLDD